MGPRDDEDGLASCLSPSQMRRLLEEEEALHRERVAMELERHETVLRQLRASAPQLTLPVRDPRNWMLRCMSRARVAGTALYQERAEHRSARRSGVFGTGAFVAGSAEFDVEVDCECAAPTSLRIGVAQKHGTSRRASYVGAGKARLALFLSTCLTIRPPRVR